MPSVLVGVQASKKLNLRLYVFAATMQRRMQSDIGTECRFAKGYCSSDWLTHVVFVTEELRNYSKGSKELMNLI